MNSGRKAGIIVLVAVVLLLGIAAYGLFAVDKPRIQSVDNSWGTVTENQSEIETAITVENPLLLSVGDGVADVRYTVALNDVEFASERKSEVQLSGRDDVINVSTSMNNDKIPQWWVTHINRNQTTTVTVDPQVVVLYGDFEAPAEESTRTRTFETDLLEPLNSEQPRQFSAFDRTVFTITETDARWGTATAEQTPINGSITARNELPIALPITEIQYTIRMNGIVVGQGTAAEETVIPAGSTRTIDTNATVDNSRLDEWWVTHLQNNETTQLSVDFTATVEYGGEERDIPLDSVSYNRSFQTNVFESANET